MDLEKEININFWRQHIVEGLLKAKRDANRVLEIMRIETNPEQILIEQLLFSPEQAQCLLELNRPIDEIDEELLVAEQRKLKEIEAELRART